MMPIVEFKDKWPQLRQAGSGVVAAAGGDGTVSTVAGFLAGTEFSLGVIPTGTLNHFAKDLDIPVDIEQAVGVIAASKTKLVDTAKINGRVFVNNSSIGVYPDMVKTRDKHASKVGKWPASIWGLLAQLPAPRAYQYRLRVNGQSSYCHTPFIFVGNNSYKLEEAGIANRTKLTEGKLCIYVIKTKSRLRLVVMAVRSLMGRVETEPGFETFEATEFTVESPYRRAADVAMDGEVETFDFPLEYLIQPQSLRVVVP